VATDNDRAGQQAAHRAYWKLTAHQQAPRQLTADTTLHTAGPGGPAAKDPAELLQLSGPGGLRAALDAAGPLATTVINDRVGAHADRLQWAEGRLAAVRDAAPVIAALPISDWPAHISLVAERTGVPHPQVTLEVLAAAEQWHTDPRAAAARQLTQPVPARPSPPPTPAKRWARLADTLLPGLTHDRDWPALAQALDRATADGYNVHTGLTEVAARRPLPPDHIARELHARLIAVCPAAMPPALPNRSGTHTVALRRHGPGPTPEPGRGRGR